MYITISLKTHRAKIYKNMLRNFKIKKITIRIESTKTRYIDYQLYKNKIRGKKEKA